MGQEIVTAAAESLAAQAFNDLGEEIRVTRREVERIADERTAQPDYGPSIEVLSKQLEDLRALGRAHGATSRAQARPTAVR